MKTLLYRVYRKGKPLQLIGTVEAVTSEEAIKNALEGRWIASFDRNPEPLTEDNIVVSV